MGIALYSARLNGIGLETLDRRIHITDIVEKGARVKITTGEYPCREGLRILKRERVSRAVTVSFVLWEKDKRERLALLDRVTEWADAGGRLSVGYRDGQEMRVSCDALPDISGRKWADDLQVAFISYDPYWRSVDPTTVSGTAAANAATEKVIRPGGTGRFALLEFDIKNNGAQPMTSASIGVNNRMFALDGFSLAAGKTLAAAYDENGALSIKADGTSVLDKRSAASADDLIILQRENNTVSVTANQASAFTLRVFERWV